MFEVLFLDVVELAACRVVTSSFSDTHHLQLARQCMYSFYAEVTGFFGSRRVKLFVNSIPSSC
jgi:hypothetical protein